MMSINTGDTELDEAALKLMSSVLLPLGSGGEDEPFRYDVASFYDFSSYRFFLDPVRLRSDPADTGDTTDGTQIPVGVFIEFDDFAAMFRTWVQARVEEFVWVDGWTINETNSGYLTAWDSTVSSRRRLTALALSGVAAFRIGMAPVLYAAYKRSRNSVLYLETARERVAALVASWLLTLKNAEGVVDVAELRRIETVTFWSERSQQVLDAIDLVVADSDTGDADDLEPGLEELPGSYSFEPFVVGSINFGLQVMYRQDWIALGTKPGEIVRTLPLGPQQTEKVTVKALRKSKATRSSEVATSVETSTESSAATKDSQEVVEEASDSLNLHAEATASASFGFGSGSLTAGMASESASSSRDTKSTLNETMEKTASKLRTDTKIIVSTEIEETSDFTRVSEISNPNDEVAVTYIYSRLQRQYEIRTYLSDVNLVLFVAERVPAPSELDDAWIRQHDWILARALLDQSFAADLDTVRAGRPNAVGNGVDPAIQSVMNSLATGIPDYAEVSGTVPDFFENPQQAYERELERSRARSAAQSQYFRSLNRLRRHIFDNILHYLRAIWGSEDPEQRLLRYENIRVATNWEFIPTGPPTATGVPGSYAPAVYNYETDTAALSEMINPAGPIGYAGNYAAFYLTESTRWSSLLAALGHLQAPFMGLVVEVDAPEAAKVAAVGSETRIGDGIYRMTIAGAAPGEIDITQDVGNNTFEPAGSRPLTNEIRFAGLVVRIGDPGALVEADEIILRVSVIPKLDDPELKAIRATHGPLSDAAEAEFFDAATLELMASMFTSVRRDLASEFEWQSLSVPQRSSVRSRYHSYLLRARHSRRILVDTNNLLLTREVDATSTLEPFKALHRAADVLTAYEELTSIKRENERLRRRLDSNRLGDPDIDKLTVVAASGDLLDAAALDGLTPDGPVDPGTTDPDDGT